MEELRAQLLEHAVAVAAILNVVEGREEHDALLLDFDRRLHDELYAGRPS